MTQATGAMSRIVLGFESAYKTVATDGFVLPVNSCSVKPTRNKNTAQTIRGNLNPVQPFDGNLSVSGDIVVPVDSTAFWYFLALALGLPTTTGTGPYVHTYLMGTTRPSFTLESQFQDLATPRFFRYLGCKIGSMKIEMGGDGELTASFGVTGASYSIETVSFDASPTVINLSRLQNKHLALTEGGSALSNAMSFSLDINFNLDTDQYCIGGGGVLGALPDGVYGISGSMKALFEDITLLTKAQNSTESSVVATFTNGASSILSFNLPEIQYQEDMPSIEGPKGVQLTLPFMAYYEDATEATALQVVLTNGDEHA